MIKALKMKKLQYKYIVLISALFMSLLSGCMMSNSIERKTILIKLANTPVSQLRFFLYQLYEHSKCENRSGVWADEMRCMRRPPVYNEDNLSISLAFRDVRGYESITVKTKSVDEYFIGLIDELLMRLGIEGNSTGLFDYIIKKSKLDDQILFVKKNAICLNLNMILMVNQTVYLVSRDCLGKVVVISDYMGEIEVN